MSKNTKVTIHRGESNARVTIPISLINRDPNLNIRSTDSFQYRDESYLQLLERTKKNYKDGNPLFNKPISVLKYRSNESDFEYRLVDGFRRMAVIDELNKEKDFKIETIDSVVNGFAEDFTSEDIYLDQVQHGEGEKPSELDVALKLVPLFRTTDEKGKKQYKWKNKSFKTQQQLASELGYSNAMVSNWESMYDAYQTATSEEKKLLQDGKLSTNIWKKTIKGKTAISNPEERLNFIKDSLKESTNGKVTNTKEVKEKLQRQKKPSLKQFDPKEKSPELSDSQKNMGFYLFTQKVIEKALKINPDSKKKIRMGDEEISEKYLQLSRQKAIAELIDYYDKAMSSGEKLKVDGFLPFLGGKNLNQVAEIEDAEFEEIDELGDKKGEKKLELLEITKGQNENKPETETETETDEVEEVSVEF